MRRALAFVLAAALSGAAWSAGGATAASSLKIGIGARGQALGDAFSADAGSADALHWNPAGLSTGDERSVMLGFQPMVEGAALGHAAASGRFGGWALGAGFAGLQHDDLDAFDAAGNSEGAFKAQDQTFFFGAALGRRAFSVGAAVKYWRSEIDGESAAAPAVDVGIQFENPFAERLRHALVARHLGGDVSYVTAKDPLPTTGVFGSSLRLGALTLSLDGAFERGGDPWVGGGVEWSVLRSERATVQLRGGYNNGRAETEKLGGASFGLGLGFRSVHVDYAWVPFGELGDAHALTLSWRPASQPSPLKARSGPAQKTSPTAKGKIGSGNAGRRTLDDLEEAPRRR